MVAARADVQIVLPLLDEHHLLALAAFVPEVVGGIALRGEGQGVAEAVDPAHAAISFAPWIASARVRVKASRCGAACSPCSAMMSTKADPTTTPSATFAIAAACSGVRTPKPTATGRSVAALRRVTASSMLVCAACWSPVMPATDT